MSGLLQDLLSKGQKQVLSLVAFSSWCPGHKKKNFFWGFPWGGLPPPSPHPVVKLVQGCLEKKLPQGE